MIKTYGLIGAKLNHSLSPPIHNSIFARRGIKANYCLFEVRKGELQNTVPALKALGIKGANITVPYKTIIMNCLENVSKIGEKIGAINTIDIKDNVAVGYNTDYYGFGQALAEHGITVNNKSAVILGTGGAAGAIFQYLVDGGIGSIIFISSTRKNGVYRNCPVISPANLDLLPTTDLLINCTPVGMQPDINRCPLPTAYLAKFNTIFDLIYNPPETALLKCGKKMGLLTINGLYMLVAQAVKAQEIWTGIDSDKILTDEIYSNLNIRLNRGII